MFVLTNQVLSPLEAYLSQAPKLLGINTINWQVEPIDFNSDAWQADFIVGEYTSDSILAVASEQAVISLAHTGGDDETIDGAATCRHQLRITSAASEAAVARSNRDAAIVFIQYGLQNNEITFPGLKWTGLYTLIARPQLQYIKKDRVHIAPATVLMRLENINRN